MDDAPSYAEIVALGMVGQQLSKRLIGKPYIKYGQCPAIWGYLFEVGGILAGKHNTQLDAFESAFLAGKAAGSIQSVFKNHADATP